MLDFETQATLLYHQGVLKGVRPLFMIIEKGNHPYKGRYVMSIKDQELHFLKLNIFYSYHGSKKDFIIKFSKLTGYRLDYLRRYERMLTLYFIDGTKLEASFDIGFEKAHGNEVNIKEIEKIFKENSILKKNKIKGEKNA